MRKIKFTKLVASGNDFVLIEKAQIKIPDSKLPELARNICDRKLGIGADGLLVLGKSAKASARMRIFNADGSEAEMCGNGARCVVFYLQGRGPIETKAGIIDAKINNSNIQIKLTDPRDIKLDLPVKVGKRQIRVNYLDTGVPHAVVFVQGIDKINVFELGRQIRYHQKFSPRGTNVDFVEVLSKDAIRVRTYERGVEDETLACGTGSTASAIAFALKSGAKNKVSVLTQSKEVLTVYFNRVNNKINNVWLEGRARIVYQGEYYV